MPILPTSILVLQLHIWMSALRLRVLASHSVQQQRYNYNIIQYNAIATFLAVSIMHMFNEIVRRRISPITHYQKQKYQFRSFVLPAFTSWAMILLPLSITTNQPLTPHQALLPLCSPALPLFSKGIHRKWISISASFNSLVTITIFPPFSTTKQFPLKPESKWGGFPAKQNLKRIYKLCLKIDLVIIYWFQM